MMSLLQQIALKTQRINCYPENKFNNPIINIAKRALLI